MAHTATTVLVQKFKKVQQDPTYDPFASGEIAVSMRYMFEHMQQVGLTSHVEAHIKANGVRPAVSSDFTDTFRKLSLKGVKLPPTTRKTLVASFTENGESKAKVFEDLVKEHGLWTIHRLGSLFRDFLLIAASTECEAPGVFLGASHNFWEVFYESTRCQRVFLIYGCFDDWRHFYDQAFTYGVAVFDTASYRRLGILEQHPGH